jgi:hypothetical protein
MTSLGAVWECTAILDGTVWLRAHCSPATRRLPRYANNIAMATWYRRQRSRLRIPLPLHSSGYTPSLIITIRVVFLSLSLKCWTSKPSESVTASYHIPSHSSFTIIRHRSLRTLFNLPLILFIQSSFRVRHSTAGCYNDKLRDGEAMNTERFPALAKMFPFSSVRIGLGPTHLPIQWTTRAL